MTTIPSHGAYIAAAPEPFRPMLERLRAILASALPDAEEVVAYNMPGFTIGGGWPEGDQDRDHLFAAQADPGRPRREAGAGLTQAR